ncbi:hypothetical protein ACHAXT_012769 [Thalassiosira profunda]
MEASSATADAPRRQRRRSLDESNAVRARFADWRGREYDPDSLAWRYLGVYMDCDADGTSISAEDISGEDGDDCRRRIMWAAYRDPHYEDHFLDEYALFDSAAGTYDNSTCLAATEAYENVEDGPRCTNLDCHEANSGFQLVGVFAETDGLYEFTRELMRHQGYCVGGGYGGNETEVWMDEWPTACTAIVNPDLYGSDLYLDFHPLPGGNVTWGIYTDPRCATLSLEYDLSSYLAAHYYAYYKDEEAGLELAGTYNSMLEQWNERMEAFKTCQPCRTYDLFAYEGEESADGEEKEAEENSGDEHEGEDASAEEDEAEGSGDEDGEAEGERWLSEYDDARGQGRYDCTDYEGYVNANQCELFGETNLEVAKRKDLARASAQGSIMQIRAHWRTYGGTPKTVSVGMVVGYTLIGLVAAAGLAWLVFFCARRRKRRGALEALKETLTEADDGTTVHSHAHSHSTGSHSMANDGRSAGSAEEGIETGIEITILSTSRAVCAPVKKPQQAPSAEGGDWALEDAAARRRALLETLGRATEVTRVRGDADGDGSAQVDAAEARRRALLETLGRATEVSHVRGDARSL